MAVRVQTLICSAASLPVRTACSWRSFLKKLYSVINLFVILITAGALNAQNPTVSVDKSSLSFSAQTGGSAQSQSLTINNAGSANFAVFSNAFPWLKVNGQPSIAGSTPGTITVS